jgi:hypothetical protein
MKFSAGILLAFLGLTNGFVSQQSASARLGATELFERKAFITGNWKLNPQTKQEAITLAQEISQAVTADSPCDIALFVPFVFLETVKNIVGDKLLVGAEVGKSLFCHSRDQRSIHRRNFPWHVEKHRR